MKVILASQSPRRRELLKRIYVHFEILPSSVEEIVPPTLLCEDAPAYLAALKAGDIAERHPDALVIGADTGVFIDGKMLGKPRDRAHAREMLGLLSGREHTVITGVALFHKGRSHCFTAETRVRFYPLNEAEIEGYIATDEPYDKAGGYGIQGNGMLLVESIEGDYNNAVGLPLARLKREIDIFLK